MGIAYVLIRATPETVEALRNRPKAVAEFVYQDSDAYEEPKPGTLSRLFGRGANPDELPVPERREDDETDLDKSWHIVHYLLTGATGPADGPLGLIGDDHHPLAELDLGLGRPNVISPQAVRAFSESASGMSDEAFLARFIPERMPTDELYLGEVIARGDVEEMKEYALENFHLLRDFTQRAAAEGDAIITYYT